MKTKFINIIYIINAIAFVSTILLFATIIWGFLAEIVLGGVQVLSWLLLSTIFWNQYSKREKKKLITYGVMVLIYFSLWLVNWDFLQSGLVLIVGIGFIPMGIALYFTVLLSELRASEEVDLTEEIGYKGI